MFRILKLIPFVSAFSSLPALALVAFLAGGSSTYYVIDTINKAALSEEMSEALVRQNKAVREVINQSDEIRASDHKYFEEIIAKTKASQAVSKIITKEIVKYVPQESDSCNYSIGAVGLLNYARQPNVSSWNPTMPDASRGSNESLHSPSNHSRIDEMEAHLQCVDQYNKLAVTSDALIDWINENKK